MTDLTTAVNSMIENRTDILTDSDILDVLEPLKWLDNSESSPHEKWADALSDVPNDEQSIINKMNEVLHTMTDRWNITGYVDVGNDEYGWTFEPSTTKPTYGVEVELNLQQFIDNVEYSDEKPDVELLKVCKNFTDAEKIHLIDQILKYKIERLTNLQAAGAPAIILYNQFRINQFNDTIQYLFESMSPDIDFGW